MQPGTTGSRFVFSLHRGIARACSACRRFGQSQAHGAMPPDPARLAGAAIGG
jgi:hypothetical protein